MSRWGESLFLIIFSDDGPLAKDFLSYQTPIRRFSKRQHGPLLKHRRPPPARKSLAIDELLCELQVSNPIILPNIINMAKDKAGSLDKFPRSGRITAGSGLPDSFIRRLSNDSITAVIDRMGLGARVRGKKARIAEAEPRRRNGTRIVFFFGGLILIGEPQTDKCTEQTAAHWLLRIIEVVTGN